MSDADGRAAAEELIDRNSESVVSRFLLGVIHHYGEGNLPRSKYHLKKALSMVREQFGDPVDESMAGWEQGILRELARTCAQLGDYEEAIEYYHEHDNRHPDALPEVISTVWALMRLRRYDEGLRVAHAVLRDPSANPGDRYVALNGYVAVLFERGDRQEAYKWAKQLTGEQSASPTFWANASEMARGILELAEAESFAIESTRRGVSDYAQPWIDIADIRLRGGRLQLAFDALRSDRAYRSQRPEYLEQQGAASAQRTVSMLMLLNNDSEFAADLTRRSVVQPDRSGGKSRDDRQDHATSALLDFRARQDRAAQLEDHLAIAGGVQLADRADVWQLRAQSVSSAARSRSFLHDNEVLIGMLRTGGPLAVAAPPWLVPELVHIVGPGIVNNAAKRAEEIETFEPIHAYFTAYRAEAEYALGDLDEAAKLAGEALETLPEKEVMLGLRMRALMGAYSMDEGRDEGAYTRLRPVVNSAPTLLRWLNIPIPLKSPSDGEAKEVTQSLMDTDRYVYANHGFEVQLNGSSLCLLDDAGGQVKCVTPRYDEDMSADERRISQIVQFHDRIFRPNDALPSMGLKALDGTRSAPSGGNKGLRNIAE